MAQNPSSTIDDKPLDFAVLCAAVKNKLWMKGKSLFGWSTVTAKADSGQAVDVQTKPSTTQEPTAEQHMNIDRQDDEQRIDMEQPIVVEQKMDVEQRADAEQRIDAEQRMKVARVINVAQRMAAAQGMDAVNNYEEPRTQEENSNINANEQSVSHKTRPRPSAAKSKKKRVVKKSRALVARSYGRPKLTVTRKTKKKPSQSSEASASKRSKNLKILKKRLDKLKEDVHDICRSLNEELIDPCEGTSSGTRASMEDKATKGYSAETVAHVPWPAKEHKNEHAQKRQKYRTQRKTLDLINSYKAGPSHEGQYNTKIHQRHKCHRTSKNDGRCLRSKGKSNLTSPRLPLRYGSSESLDWPSLPTTERTKGVMKETAKEIVKNKQSGSFMKMSRKGWADVVRRSEENVRVVAKHSDETNRTWASVASYGASTLSEQVANAKDNKTEIPVRPSNSSQSKSKCLFDGEAQGSAKEKPLTLKETETRTTKNGTLHENKESNKKSRDSKLIVDSSNAEHENCCIDRMSFVDTKQVSSVIDLNEGIAKRKKGINKCNNRTATPYKLRDSVKRSAGPSKISCQKGASDLELCDRLSLMSVNTLSEASETSLHRVTKAKQRALASPTQKTSRIKKAGTYSSQKENMKANQDEPDRSKPKKVAVRYRALMQGESGRLNAKTLTEMNSRTRRNEILLVDKKVNRNLQRKQRQDRQQTSHNLQRSPIEKPKVRNALDNKLTEKQAKPSAVETSTPNKDQPCSSKQCDELLSKQCDELTSKQCDGLNKSENRHSVNALNNPMCATKAVKLSRQAKMVCLEHLTDNEDVLDLGWCHAYLVQHMFAQEDDDMNGSDVRRNK